jgi:hypothetical protein
MGCIATAQSSVFVAASIPRLRNTPTFAAPTHEAATITSHVAVICHGVTLEEQQHSCA